MIEKTRADYEAEKLIYKNKIARYPIDIESIAQSIDLKVVYARTEKGIYGFLRKNKGESIIGINIICSITEQKFVIAYFIGHLVLHLKKSEAIIIKRDSSSALISATMGANSEGYFDELDANAFALALLMPKDLVQASFDEYSKNYTSLEDITRRMANDFNTSIQAMTIRLIKLNLFK